LEKDSISFVNVVVEDSVSCDSVQRPIFSFAPIKNGIVDVVCRQTSLQTSTSQDSNDVLRHQGTPLPFNLEQTDSIFCILLICLLFFTHIYNGGISFIKENIAYLYSPEKTFRKYGQTITKEVLYNYFLVAQSIVLVSICLYDTFFEYEKLGYSNGRTLSTIVSFIVLIALFLGIKDFIYRIVGYVFDIQKTVIVWRKSYTISVEILGILYFVPTLLLIYSNYYHGLILGFMLILFLVVQIILFYQIIAYFIEQKFNFLFLIAYLCTFEILPYVYLSMGLIYLYRTDVFNTLLWP
jgi:hypothetical protein